MALPLTDVLAVWRLTRLVVADTITQPLRDAVSTRWPGSRLDLLLSCRHCVGVWVALAWVLVGPPRRLATALAAAAVVSMWEELRGQTS